MVMPPEPCQLTGAQLQNILIHLKLYDVCFWLFPGQLFVLKEFLILAACFFSPFSVCWHWGVLSAVRCLQPGTSKQMCCRGGCTAHSDGAKHVVLDTGLP